MTSALLLALTAGMLGAVNPCGFALLPAYLSIMVAGEDPDPWAAVARALRCSAALAVGFVAVFGVFGLALMPLAGVLQPRLPWLTVAFGLALAALGGWLLAGRSLPTPNSRVRAPALTGSTWSMTVFGAAYAVASLGCAAGPFLALVAGSLREGSVLPFLAYAAGMALVVGVTAVAVALVRASVVARMRRLLAVVPRLGGAVLLVSGLYVAWYGWYELRLAGNLRLAGTDPVVAAAGRLQRTLAEAVSATGAVPLGVALAALVLLPAVVTLLRAAAQRRAGRSPAAPGTVPPLHSTAPSATAVPATPASATPGRQPAGG